MKKRILLLSSSPRRHGNSDRLCDEFLRGAREAGARRGEDLAARLPDRLLHRLRRLLRYPNLSATGRCGADRREDDRGRRDRTGYAGLFLYDERPDEDADRSLLRTLHRDDGQGVLFYRGAADDSKAAMERTIDGFRGFLDCLDDSRECGTIYGVGAWKIGEIEGSPAMKQAYDAGLNC